MNLIPMKSGVFFEGDPHSVCNLLGVLIASTENQRIHWCFQNSVTRADLSDDVQVTIHSKYESDHHDFVTQLGVNGFLIVAAKYAEKYAEDTPGNLLLRLLETIDSEVPRMWTEVARVAAEAL